MRICLPPQQSVRGRSPLASGLGREVSIVTEGDHRRGVAEPARQGHDALPRSGVESRFAHLKQFRAIATRSDKLADSYHPGLVLAC
jgi:hypothetical protein